MLFFLFYLFPYTSVSVFVLYLRVGRSPFQPMLAEGFGKYLVNTTRLAQEDLGTVVSKHSSLLQLQMQVKSDQPPI